MAKTDSKTPEVYEKHLVELMWQEKLTLGEAMYIDMTRNGVDTESVFDVVDFMESKLGNLDKVQYYMEVFTGQQPDVILKKNIE